MGDWMKSAGIQEPFRALCEYCGTIAESWHHSAPSPPGARVGVAYCGCRRTAVDSLGRQGMGRVSISKVDGDGEQK